MPRKKLLLSLLIVAVLAGGTYWYINRSDSSVNPQNSATGSTGSNSSTTPPSFDKGQYSTTDPTSIWVVVNKPHALNPVSYTPSDLVMPAILLRVPGNESMQLRKVTSDAMTSLFAGAKAENLNLMLSSGYRSYAYQVGLYNGYVKSMGQAAADTQSARPGHSEHQTGLAADLEPASRKCELDQCFANTPEGKWLAANAYKYGFVIRYPADKVAITGYEYEPWHIRYVGVELATEMHNQGIETLEEFFGITGGPNY